MKKLVCLFLLVSWLAACSSGGTTESATAVSQPSTTSPTSQATAVTTADETEEETAPSDSGGAQPIVIAQTAAEAAQIRATDWTKGAAASITDPLVSIIEYGDFQ